MNYTPASRGVIYIISRLARNIPAGYGVRQNTNPVTLALGYHSQTGLSTDKTPCPLCWDTGGNLNPFSKVVATWAFPARMSITLKSIHLIPFDFYL